MPRKRDLTGLRFGTLSVVRECGRQGEGNKAKVLYLCQCDCGRSSVVIAGNLVGGSTKTCGCSRYRHGVPATEGQKGAYSSWKGMKARCKSRHPKHRHYVKVGYCERWESFANFYADMGDRPPGMSIDRIDNDKGYEPGNCRWATKIEQEKNKRR